MIMDTKTLLWVVDITLALTVAALSWRLIISAREVDMLANSLADMSTQKRVYHREAIGHYTRVRRLEEYIRSLGGAVPPTLNDEILGRIPEDKG